jgi:hypothetical protein
MKRITLVAVVALLASSHTHAQDVRALGLGGARAPGPGLSTFNPAYSAYPPESGRGAGFVLPLGLLNFLFNPQLNVIDFITNTRAYADPGNPNAPEFNALAAFDQITHLNTLILNPVRAPREINVNISGSSGVTLTDENGQVISTSFSSNPGFQYASAYSAAGASPLVRVPFSVGPVSLGLGVFFYQRGPSVDVDTQLLVDIAAGGGRLPPNKTYPRAISAAGGVAAGITVDAGLAMPIALPTATVYVGARATAFYGLANAEIVVNGALKTGSDGSLSSTQPSYNYTTFLALPGSGYGYGANLDGGVATDIPGANFGVPSLEVLTLGVGIVGLVDFYRWEGQERTVYSDGTSTTTPATRSSAGFDPVVTVNAAARFSFAGGVRVLALSDVQFGRNQFSGHIGAEATIGLLQLRGGLGVDGGLRFGLGASLEFAPNLGVDLALTTHQAPFYAHTNFGIALAARLGF